jgi:hypothetical protein
MVGSSASADQPRSSGDGARGVQPSLQRQQLVRGQAGRRGHVSNTVRKVSILETSQVLCQY